MIEKLLLNGNEVRIQVDDTFLRAKVWGYDSDYDLMVNLEIRKEGESPCYAMEELSCAVEELEDRIRRSNKFKIWIGDEEI